MAPQSLAPFVPSLAEPFDRRRAAHLLRRAGFGAASDEIGKAVERGMEAAVEGLFADPSGEDAEFQKTFAAINGRLMNFADADAVRSWWLYRMLATNIPLREKLALFWHGHFATSVEKVEDLQLMHGQIETFRTHAWGNVRDLVQAVARDPAMLVWLDGVSSTKDHPNENFARELMELFTCGIGHYTEADVKEAARAFTGWGRDGAKFVFKADDHDGGRKKFLGKSGKFDGVDIVDVLMQQPATLTFLARKLLRFFAAPEPAPEVVAEAAELLGRTRLDVKWFLRELFQSRYFYSNDCYRQRISSPVEYVVGSVRALGARWPATDFAESIKGMGQELLAPPNVKGWDGERKWINSGTWEARVEFAKKLAELAGEGAYEPNLDVGKIVPADARDPVRVVAALTDRLLEGDVSPKARRDLTVYLTTTDVEGPVRELSRDDADMFRDDADFREHKIRGALAVVLSLPEYHAY